MYCNVLYWIDHNWKGRKALSILYLPILSMDCSLFTKHIYNKPQSNRIELSQPLGFFVAAIALNRKLARIVIPFPTPHPFAIIILIMWNSAFFFHSNVFHFIRLCVFSFSIWMERKYDDNKVNTYNCCNRIYTNEENLFAIYLFLGPVFFLHNFFSTLFHISKVYLLWIASERAQLTFDRIRVASGRTHATSEYNQQNR